MADLLSRLPLEVQQMVFDILHANSIKEELTPFLVVNKYWFVHISRRIYREAKLHTIWQLRDSPNAEHYLSIIRCLTFGLGDHTYHHEIIEKWAQPPLHNLEKVSFVPGAVFQGHEVDYIIPYLQPSISTVQLFGVRWTLQLLSALHEMCKGLKELSIKYPFKGKDFSFNAQSFDSWLQAFPSLSSISVFYTDGNGNEKPASNAWTKLFSQPTLRSLLNRPLRRLRIEHRLEDWKSLSNSAAFSSLRELSIIARLKDIARLSELADLRKLHILVNDEPQAEQREVITPLCSMTGLKSLRVIFVKLHKLYASEVMSLTSLSNLEELDIFNSHQETIATDNSDIDDANDDDETERRRYTPIQILPSFDENDFDVLASSLPKLRHVCLLFDWMPNSYHVLKSAAYLWRELEYLCLGYNIDLPEAIIMARNSDAVFPYMKQFMKVRACIGDLAPDTEAIRGDRDARYVLVFFIPLASNPFQLAEN